MNLKAGGLGTLGHDQLEWLEDTKKDFFISSFQNLVHIVEF